MDNRDIIERTALELIKLYPQLGCWPACGLGVRGSRRGDAAAGDKGTATRPVVEITGPTPWLWHTVDQPGVLNVLVQSRRDKSAAKRLLRKLPKQQCRVPRVMITDELGGESLAQQEPVVGIEHRRRRGSAMGPKSAPGGIMVRTGQMKRFTSARQARHFPSARDPINNLFPLAAIAADDAAVVNSGAPAGAHMSRRRGQRSAPSIRAAELVTDGRRTEPRSSLPQFLWATRWRTELPRREL
jgi:DDE domain